MKIIVAFSNALRDGRRFFLEELWAKDLDGLKGLRRVLFSLCRIAMIVGRDFQNNKCSLQASGLTYITLVSMVPVLAIMFSFSKGLGMQNKLMSAVGLEVLESVTIVDGEEVKETRFQVVTTAAAQESEDSQDDAQEASPGSESLPVDAQEALPSPEASGNAAASRASEPAAPPPPPPPAGLASSLPPPMQQVLVSIFTYVEKTSFATLGLIGSLMLLITVIISMSKLEDNLNTIWGVKKGRPISRKISEYLVVLILLPIVFLLATSLNAVISSHSLLAYLSEHAPTLAWVIRKSFAILAAIFITGGFTFFYIFMPNTSVKIFPAVIAGFVAGIMWSVLQWAYLSLQVGLTNYNAIYGTFAVVPFFLAWLYASWGIILVGAEISFAIQNHRTMRWERISDQTSNGACVLLAVMVVYKVCRAFSKGEPAWQPLTYARENGISTRIMHRVLESLQQAGIIVAIAQDDKADTAFLPSRDPQDLTLAIVEEAFRDTHSRDADSFMQHLPAKLAQDFTSRYQKFQDDLARRNFQELAAID